MDAKINAISDKLDSIMLSNANNQSKIDSISIILQNQEALNAKIESVITKVDAIEERTSILESAMKDVYGEINSLKTSNQHLSVEINKVQQESLSHHVVIRNLPPGLSRESASKIIEKIAASSGTTLESGDFQTQPYILQQRDKKTSHIIAALFDIRKKQDLLAKFKVARPILVEDVCDGLRADSDFRGKEIALGNQLTRTNRTLLYHARQHKDVFQFAWENSGRVLLRQKTGAPTIEVTSLGHLDFLANRLRQNATGGPSHMITETSNRK